MSLLAACGGPPPHCDCRPDLKAPYTAIVRARDEGELSLAAAQLHGGLRHACANTVCELRALPSLPSSSGTSTRSAASGIGGGGGGDGGGDDDNDGG